MKTLVLVSLSILSALGFAACRKQHAEQSSNAQQVRVTRPASANGFAGATLVFPPEMRLETIARAEEVNTTTISFRASERIQLADGFFLSIDLDRNVRSGDIVSVDTSARFVSTGATFRHIRQASEQDPPFREQSATMGFRTGTDLRQHSNVFLQITGRQYRTESNETFLKNKIEELERLTKIKFVGESNYIPSAPPVR